MGRSLIIFNKWTSQCDFRKPCSYFLKLCLLFCGFHFFHKLKDQKPSTAKSLEHGFPSQAYFLKSSKSQANASYLPQIFAECFKALERNNFCFVFVFKYVQESPFARWQEEVTRWLRPDPCPQQERFHWMNYIRLSGCWNA